MPRGMNGERVDIYGLSRERLADLLRRRFEAPPYRAVQIFGWLYRRQARDFAVMTDINAGLRSALAGVFEVRPALMRDRRLSADGTRKYLWEVSPGVPVETVLIPQPGRNTVCVSTQHGCAMGCAFCRTAGMGLRGNLEAGDMVRQAAGAARELAQEGEALQNVVFMGMGEPLHNAEALLEAVRILVDPHGFGLGPRKITVSTAGLAPGIKALGAAGLDVSLAVSLNAAHDELRSRLMPINRTYPLRTLLEALREYPLKPRRRITIEYVMLAGINDSDAELDRLTALLKGLRVKVNLLPYNENPGLSFRASSAERIQAWQQTLREKGFQANVRWSRGADILGACGQLATAGNRSHPFSGI